MPTNRFLFATFALGLACAGSYSVPSSLQGDVPLRIANLTAVAMCTFRVSTGPYTSNAKNWIGFIKPQAGTAKELKIKPGMYTVTAIGCQDQFAGTIHDVEIRGPTSLAITPVNSPVQRQDLAAAPGHTPVMLPVHMSYAYLHPPVYQQGGGGNSSEPGESTAGEDTSSESSSSDSSSSSKAESSAPTNTNTNCKPSGATCDQSYQCCSGACVTHSPDNYCR